MMDHHALLEELGQFPLLDAMFGRRSRRFGLGMTIPDGPLAYASTQPPLPLSDLERTLLVLCGAGVSGWHLGMEHTANGDPDTGCNYPVRLTGRVAASAAGIETAELIVSDESGTFITRFRDLDPARLREVQDATDLGGLVARVNEHCIRLSDNRVELPAAAPHISAHNHWNANRPGTTLFIPIVDMAQQVLDFLAIYLAGGVILWDPIRDRPCGNLDRFVASGMLDARKRMSIVDIEQYVLATGAIELGLICQNIVLLLQAMGLGGWMFTGINPPSLLGAFAADGIPGLGFRFTRDPAWSQPNPVGRDGVFEGLCPPYFLDMRAAVERFVEIKFGPGGTYDPARAGPFRDNARVKAKVERYSPQLIDALVEVSQYLHEVFGKFPATIPSVYVRMYAQAQHVDLDYYDAFYGAEATLETHRQHLTRWHARGRT
jgi:hypothetical protein